MADKYRAGIIGLGFIGGADQVSGDALGQLVSDLSGTHLDAYANHERIELVAGSSRDPGRRERFGARTEAKTYASWEEMVERESLDIVSVATYTPQHDEMTVTCAKAGVRAIFCEKPIASTVSRGDDMVEACRRTGTLLAINHNRRFNPAYRRLRDEIAEGRLGDLISASLQWGTGRLGNVGTHYIDALQMLTGLPVNAVCGVLDPTGRPDCRGPEFVDPGGWGLLRLEGGVLATVDAPDFPDMPHGITINGSRGRVTIAGKQVTVEDWGGEPDTRADETDGPNEMDRAAAEIVEWLDSGKTFPYDVTEAVRTLEAIAGFHASHDRGGWVVLPLEGADRDLEVRSG